MQDTSPEMRKKQYEIFFGLPLDERVRQGVEMVNFGLLVVENGIKSQKPTISEKELKIEKIKRLYSRDFSKEDLARIIHYFEALQ